MDWEPMTKAWLKDKPPVMSEVLLPAFESVFPRKSNAHAKVPLNCKMIDVWFYNSAVPVCDKYACAENGSVGVHVCPASV